MGMKRNVFESLVINLKERGHLEELYVDGRILK